MSSRKPFVVVVDGLIGSGKTTLIGVLFKELSARGWNVTVVKEPVDKWHSTGILQRFYADPKRWGYHFQTTAFHDRVVENLEMFQRHGHTSDIFILERSPFTDTLFMELLYEAGDVDDLEMQDYQRWWKLWYKVMPYQPDLFVYLKPELEECMRRLKARNRSGEEGVSVDYQRRLEGKHDKFFAGDTVQISECSSVKCVKIETNENFKDEPHVRDKITTMFEQMIGIKKPIRD